MTEAPTEIVFVVVQCGTRICIARRSQSVGTARGLWSVVTGYLEAGIDPLSQAWIEVHEELGLRAPGIKVMRQLEPVQLQSPTSRKVFVVHPFLFECDESQQVVLNWEHDAVEWVIPTRLESADCVAWQAPIVSRLLKEMKQLS